MQIKPINDQSIEPKFVEFVTGALGLTQVLTCGRSGCKKCAPEGRAVREFVHYSRDEIQEWHANGPGNQLCWSQFIADKQIDIDSITDQPGRHYKLLCLIKVADCNHLIIRKEVGRNAIHFGFTFAVPQEKMVRIKLNSNVEQGRYACEQLL